MFDILLPTLKKNVVNAADTLTAQAAALETLADLKEGTPATETLRKALAKAGKDVAAAWKAFEAAK